MELQIALGLAIYATIVGSAACAVGLFQGWWWHKEQSRYRLWLRPVSDGYFPIGDGTIKKSDLADV